RVLLFGFTFQRSAQLRRNRNLTLFVRLRCPAELGFVAHRHGAAPEIHIVPGEVHRFLLAESAHQEELVPQAFICITDPKSLTSSSRSYISGSSSTNRGQSFLPTNPRMPCAFKNVITFSNLL